MVYYESNERQGRVAGAIAAVVYVALWIVLMLVVNFTFEKQEVGEGILINFGDVESASGDADPSEQDALANAQNSSEAPRTPDEFMTQDYEDAPEIRQPNTAQQPRPSQTDQPRTDNTQQTTTAEQPRVANPALNFPGTTQGSSSTSEGTASSGAGNQGSPEGSPAGSHDGTGTGGGGTGFNLAGRSVVGALPAPSYGANKEGRVIIEIVVDAQGVVKSASYRPLGSTTNDSELVNAARRAALQSRFSEIDGDGMQTGTITYNFKLK